MLNATIEFDNAVVENEEIKGASEFGFWSIVKGLLFDGPALADDINRAIEDAYNER